MIRRLYVDNFRSLVDFTWEPGAETLVLGYNGSGKTSALEVIELLQGICTGSTRLMRHPVSTDRTSWLDSPTITVEVDVKLETDFYRYHVSLGFEESRLVILSETLARGDATLFSREGQRVRMPQLALGSETVFPISPTESVVSVIGSDFGGEAVVPFRKSISDILYLKPSPTLLYAHKKGGATRWPEASLADLVPWYLHLAKHEGFVETVIDDLREVWPELVEIVTPEYSPDVFDFVLRVRNGATEREVPFRALSDGERMLVALYVVAAYQRTNGPTTIIIDEPDNYVSLREIQPWLLTMLDTCPDGGQIILISHNEELIRTMGREHVAYFSRKDHLSPTTVRGIRAEETEVAPLRDLLRRGWLDE